MSRIYILLFLTMCTVPLFAGALDCNAYQRFENQAHCNNTGYLLGYGFKYCNRFLTTLNLFTPQGQSWVLCTGNCLIQRTQQIVQANLNAGTNACENIKHQAFSSHPQCYISCGFCQIQRDNIKALWKTYDIGDFFSAGALNQILQVEKSCGLVKAVN